MTVNGTAGKMRKLALADEVLLSVQKPARYIGTTLSITSVNEG